MPLTAGCLQPSLAGACCTSDAARQNRRGPTVSALDAGCIQARGIAKRTLPARLPGTVSRRLWGLSFGVSRTLLNDIRVSAFFGGLFGGSQQQDPEPEAVIIPEDELPFPIELLDDTFLRGRDLARAYRASEDGFDALVFHKLVDFKGPCMIYAETDDGARFGGFNSEGFSSSDDYAASFKAFLYCWPKGCNDPVVLQKVGGPEAALFDYARGGPKWGAEGLTIGPPAAPVMGGMAGPDGGVDGAGNLRNAKCSLGQAYEMIPPEYGQRSVFGGNATDASLSEVEVYYAPELAKLYL